MKLRLPRPKMNSFFLVLSPAAKETMKRHDLVIERIGRGAGSGLYRNYEVE